ncbi:MAG: hypothetical protein CL398_00085 [Acidiferrobacteraceae bacterium]|nr:hypothetical protein [Acidiferrobacteraceae bacterium]
MVRRKVRRRYEVPPGTYRVEWANVNPSGESYVDFEYKGGSWSNFDDAWMDVFVEHAVPKVTQDGEKMGEMHQFAAETLGKKSCCCGATEKLPCECMKLGVMQCSSQPPRCPCYQAIKEDEDWAEHGVPEEESYMSTDWLKRKLGIKRAEGTHRATKKDLDEIIQEIVNIVHDPSDLSSHDALMRIKYLLEKHGYDERDWQANAEEDDEYDYDEEEWGEGPGCYICAPHVGWEEANEADAECPRCGAGGICNICADAIGEGEGGCDECYQFVEVKDAEDAEDYGVQPTWMAETELDSTNLTDWANANDTDDMKYLIGGFIGGVFATAIGAIAGEWSIQKFKSKGWL